MIKITVIRSSPSLRTAVTSDLLSNVVPHLGFESWYNTITGFIKNIPVMEKYND